MEKIINFAKQNQKYLIFVLLVVYILFRLPGINQPLHQDEYKWPIVVSPSYISDISIPHPPLGEIIYRIAGYVVGFNVHFRFVPLFFGGLNLILLYYFVRSKFGIKTAIIASGIWIISYYSILASLMVDTDGEIMPFFFLLLLIGYSKLRNEESRKWWFLILFASICGLLVKVSFILAVGAVVIDFLISKRKYLTKKEYIQYGGIALISVIGFILLLYISQFIFPFFHLSGSLKYWEHFFKWDRGWLQTAIQCIKAILYSSPLLILLPFFLKKENLSKIRVFIVFLIISFIFYIILFDFSLGALDRYLQLLVLPLSVISSVVISEVNFTDKRNLKWFNFGLILSLLIFSLQFIQHFVPPLHPKTEWIGRVLSLKWNFLYPFSGGSGPLGFYISFLFIAISWLTAFLSVIFYFFNKIDRLILISFILPICLIYNLTFAEEYLLGKINGYAPGLLVNAIEYIKNDPQIKMVTTYNDNGGNELQEIGKYRKRLYVDPKFDIHEKIKTLNMYKEDYFVLDIPRIDPSSIYAAYFASCVLVYNNVDKSISATVYDCKKAPNIKDE
jgi:hypothetical protein